MGGHDLEDNHEIILLLYMYIGNPRKHLPNQSITSLIVAVKSRFLLAGVRVGSWTGSCSDSWTSTTVVTLRCWMGDLH